MIFKYLIIEELQKIGVTKKSYTISYSDNIIILNEKVFLFEGLFGFIIPCVDICYQSGEIEYMTHYQAISPKIISRVAFELFETLP